MNQEDSVQSVLNDKQPKETLAQQRFGQHAQAYVTSAPHAQGEDLDRLLALAQPQADWRVLDVATGGGHTALKFAPYVAHVTASDITPAMLNAAERHLTDKGVTNVAFKQVAAEDMPFDDASFDLVTCRIAPHHFDDAARFVREAARVLKPCGTLLVQDHLVPDDAMTARYYEAFEKLRDPSHNQAFTEAEWRAMFAAADLAVTHVERLYKDLNVDSWAERQGVTPNTKACLSALIELAPSAVLNWMQPQQWGTSEATYRCHHIIIAGALLPCRDPAMLQSEW
ncbi:MAG: class I SAM-dependent methyltransferase [Anaerolineae bacterium]